MVSQSPTQAIALSLTLRTLAEIRGVNIGVSVGAEELQTIPTYAGLVAREFNILTTENAMKFETLRPTMDQYDFTDADSIVNYAQTHDMQVRGHTLVWTNQLPTWLIKRNWTRDQLLDILHEHIITVVSRYRGRIVVWDVVNEALNKSGELAEDNYWMKGIGPDYVELAFQWAHQADPDARLFYNDFSNEGLGPKSNGVFKMVLDLVNRGVPIHGVGFQMHNDLSWSLSPEDVAANLKRLADLGLEVHVTEMDVRIEQPSTKDELDAQAKIYGEVLGICLLASNCTTYVIWGLSDNYSWIPYFFPGWGSALIFDHTYQPKPAYYALIEKLLER